MVGSFLRRMSELKLRRQRHVCGWVMVFLFGRKQKCGWSYGCGEMATSGFYIEAKHIRWDQISRDVHVQKVKACQLISDFIKFYSSKEWREKHSIK